MSATSQPAARASISSRMRWTIIGLLCLGMMVAYFDRVNLSVAMADSHSAEPLKSFLHLTDYDRGALNSAFFWTYAVLQIPAGWVVDRYGVKFPFALGFVLLEPDVGEHGAGGFDAAVVRGAHAAGGRRIDHDARGDALDPLPLLGEPARAGGGAVHGRGEDRAGTGRPAGGVADRALRVAHDVPRAGAGRAVVAGAVDEAGEGRRPPDRGGAGQEIAPPCRFRSPR